MQSPQSLGRATGLSCDVKQERQVGALSCAIVKGFGQIDAWVNSVGDVGRAGMILNWPPAQAIQIFVANDSGALYGSLAMLHFILPRKHGTLVNIYRSGSFPRPAFSALV